MHHPHLIRLRGPWQFTPLACWSRPDAEQAGEELLPTPGRVTLPADWGATLGDDFRGRVRYERTFYCPTGLDPHERVWLVVDGADARADVILNGEPLGAVEGYALSASWDITEQIAPRNRMSLEVELPGDESDARPLRPGRQTLAGGPIGQVRLEIRSTAFIDRLAAWAAIEHDGPVLHVAGQIGGDPAADPLCLVASALEREIIYLDVAVGERFDHAAAADRLPLWIAGDAAKMATVEVKLISGGAAVWQREFETTALGIASQPGGLAVGGRATAVPIGSAEFESGDLEPQVRQIVEQFADRESGVMLPQILPEPFYTLFDTAGVPIVQAVPPEWANDVCPRLAHHPSIGAWSLPREGSSQHTKVPSPTCGRPWLT